MPSVGGGHSGGGGSGFSGGAGGGFSGGGGFGSGHSGGGFGGQPNGFGNGPEREPGDHRPGGFGFGPMWGGWGPGGGWGRRRGGFGCAAPLIVIAIAIATLVITSVIRSEIINDYADRQYNEYEIAVEYEYVTSEREKLDSSYVTEIDSYYTDEINAFKTAAAQNDMNKGLKYFYEKTGVQPYVYITDNIAGNTNPTYDEIESWLYDKYSELFNDEGHFMLMYFEYNESEGMEDNYYETWYVCGDNAKMVVDDDAAELLLSCIDEYFETSDSYSEMLSNSFADAADQFMVDYKEVPITAEPTIEDEVVSNGVTATVSAAQNGNTVTAVISSSPSSDFEQQEQSKKNEAGLSVTEESVTEDNYSATDTNGIGVSRVTVLTAGVVAVVVLAAIIIVVIRNKREKQDVFDSSKEDSWDR